MKKMKSKHAPNQPYYVGAELIIDKTKKVPESITANLLKFGSKAQAAQRWLKSFPPINTPNGNEIKRVVLRLPLGYRERKDVIEQYKAKGFNHQYARFQMLSDHSGPNNTLVYVATKPGSGGVPGDKPDAKQHQPEDNASDSVPQCFMGDEASDKSPDPAESDFVLGED